MSLCKTDLYQVISEIIGIDIELCQRIQDDENLVDYGLTSVNSIKLTLELEKKYNFVYKDEDLLPSKNNTISKILGILEQYI